MMGLSRRIIIGTYLQIRTLPGEEQNMICRICKKLGYSIDKNGSNDFIRRVIREYREEEKHSLPTSHTVVLAITA